MWDTIVGCTTNPPLSLAAVKNDLPYWNEWVDNLIVSNPGLTQHEYFWQTYREVIRLGANMTRTLIAGLGSIGRRHLRNLLALGETDIVLLRSHHATLPEEELAGYPVETDLAVALKVATVPAWFVRVCGEAIMTGGTRTVSTATALVMDDAVLVTTTR